MAELIIYAMFGFFLMGVLFALRIGKTIFNPYKWALWKSKRFKKRYAIVRFHGHGNMLFDRVMDIGGAKIETKKGLYLIQDNWVYKMVGDVKKLGEKSKTVDYKGQKLKVIEHAKIKQDFVKFEEGIPVINFDINDMLPLKLEQQETTKETRQPGHIQAVLKKERALYQYLAMKMVKQQIMMLIIVCIIVAGISAALSFVNMQSTSEAVVILKQINSTLSSIVPVEQVTP